MKVVLDTNVWISSLLLPKSIPGQIVSSWQKATFSAAISQPILDEIQKVLTYPKIQKRLALSQTDIDEYLTLIRFFTDFVELDPKKASASTKLRDKNDIPILDTLTISNANYLVTGDQDLLILNKEFPIISPNEFAKFLD